MAPGNRNNPRRAANSDATYTLMDFMADFPDDAACLDWLWCERFSPDGSKALCPKCAEVRRFSRVKSRPSYSCNTCGHHVHPTADTIFHKSSTSLQLWFHAIFLMSSTRCGISAKQLEREIGVTYKCAWRMFNRIRTLLLEDADDTPPLSGSVEADETFVGGKARAYPKRTRAEHQARKTTVFAAVERGGRVKASVIPNRGTDGIAPKVREYVLPSSILYTDEYDAYLRPGLRYDHRRIHHGERIYVSGDVHTQTIEGFFSLVKNGIRGVYHSVSAKYLQTYLNEYAFRYNHRKDSKPMFKTLIEACAASSASSSGIA